MATKFYTDRTEIAKAINGRKMPVVTIDLVEADEYGLKSEPVVIDFGTFDDGFPWMKKAKIRMYADEKKFTFSAGGACITNDFGYSDVMDMLEVRNAPVIKPDEDVLIVVKDSVNRECYIFELHTTKRVNKHCSTPLGFEDGDVMLNELFLKKAEKHLQARGEKYLRAV